MAKNKAVFGIYSTQAGVENAVSMLRDESFSSSDVAVLLPESVSSRDIGTVKATKAPEGATAGAGSGAVVGGVLGWLAGIGSRRTLFTRGSISATSRTPSSIVRCVPPWS